MHRPSGLAVGPDGSLYVADDIRGRIYRIVYTADPSGPAPKTNPCPSLTAPAGDIVQANAQPPESNTAGMPVPEGSSPEMVALGDRIITDRWAGPVAQVVTVQMQRAQDWVPDLTKTKWMWSDGSFAGILKVITNGVPQPKQYRSPMPPMGGAQLSDTQLSAVRPTCGPSAISRMQVRKSAPAKPLAPGDKISQRVCHNQGWLDHLRNKNGPNKKWPYIPGELSAHLHSSGWVEISTAFIDLEIRETGERLRRWSTGCPTGEMQFPATKWLCFGNNGEPAAPSTASCAGWLWNNFTTERRFLRIRLGTTRWSTSQILAAMDDITRSENLVHTR